MKLLQLFCKKNMYCLMLLFLGLPILTYAQILPEREVRGVVTDSKGNVLSGVTITCKRTAVSKTTDVNGVFTMTVKTGDALLFTYVSYQPNEIKVNASNIYKILLTEGNTVLNDVVVVGYGKSSKKNLSTAITTIRPEDFNKGAISDVGQLLQGKVAGLNITTSGDPNKPAAVVLRGASTVNSPGAPFYVIDGVPGADITTVAPDDIASIDVLKDASATAIYGNRASSGVIMVTTKKGKKGQSKISYSGYVGAEQVSNKLKLMDTIQLRNYLINNKSAFSPNDDKKANVDWQKSIQNERAVSHNHNISVNGGGEHSTYSASINYIDKEGILKRSRLKRIIGRLSLEQYALNDKLKLGFNVSNASSNATNVPLQNVVLLQSAKRLPISPIKNADSSYFENLGTTGYFNPVALVDNAQDDTKYTNLIGNFSVEFKLPAGFTYNANLSYQKSTALHGEYYGSYYGKYPTSNFYNNPDPGIGIAHTLIGNLFDKDGSALRSDYQNNTKNIESFLTWDAKSNKHVVNAVIGYSWQENTYGEGFQTSSANFPSDVIGYSNLSLGNPYARSSYRINAGNDLTYGQIKLISDFARLNYRFNDKYLFQASIRRDGSSVFGKNNEWGYFPAASFAWRISQENFLKGSSVSDLKLRFSYGVTGNSSGLSAYTAQDIYGRKDFFYDNGTLVTANGPVQGANPDLRWEKTATTNIGLDFALFKGRLAISVDVYDKNTTDMLYNYRVPPAIYPGGKLWANGGSINNKGIEASLNAVIANSKNFNWTTTINVAHNKNLITSLQGPLSNGDSIRYSDPEGVGQTNATLQILKVGYPIGQFFSLRYAGKDENGVSQFYKKDGSSTKGASTPGIGTDYFYIGNAQPKLMAGLNNTIRVKHVDINVFFRAVFGNKIFNATRADLSNVVAATANNILVSAKDDKITDTKNSYYSTRYIESGDYIRLDNASIGYNFPNTIKGVSNFRLYVSVNNVFTITKYSGIDPEINQGGVAPGVDYNNFYPKTSTILFGLNLSF